MPITVVGFDGNPVDQNSFFAAHERFITGVLTLKFSGNYPTGGDPLDLTNGGGTPAAPNTIPFGAVNRGLARIAVDWNGTAASFSAGGGYYSVVSPAQDRPMTFADIANLKLKVFNGGGTELAAGAYPASVLADIVTVEVFYA